MRVDLKARVAIAQGLQLPTGFRRIPSQLGRRDGSDPFRRGRAEVGRQPGHRPTVNNVHKLPREFVPDNKDDFSRRHASVRIDGAGEFGAFMRQVENIPGPAAVYGKQSFPALRRQ